MSANDSQFEQYWRRLFEYRARIRDDDAGIAGWSASGLAARYRQFVRLWREEHPGAVATGRWLDVGCGAGTYAKFLASQNLHVTAVDYSELTTHKARERCPAEIAWAVADATCLPFSSGSMDGVLCFGVMQALSSPQRALGELRRVLRPGGELWVDGLNGRCLPNAVAAAWRRRQGKPQHLRYDITSSFAEVLKSSGFDELRVHWLPVMPEGLRMVQGFVESAAVRRLLKVAPVGTWASHSFLAVATADAQAPTAP